MKTVVVTSNPRADLALVDRFARLGVAPRMTHQVGRQILKTYMRPVWPGAGIAGTVVTALTQPGDNWMIHVAAKQCRAGDVLVVACTTDNTDGMFGDLLANSLKARGVRGLVMMPVPATSPSFHKSDSRFGLAAIFAKGTAMRRQAALMSLSFAPEWRFSRVMSLSQMTTAS